VHRGFIILLRTYLRLAPFDKGKWRLIELLRRHLASNPLQVILRMRSGILINADTSDFIQREVFIKSEFEPEVENVLRAFLRPGDTFVDVGANIGIFSLLAAQIVGPRGRVIAFEPVPITLEKLRANILLNNLQNITVVPVALSDETRRGFIHLDGENNSGASSFRKSRNSRECVDVAIDTFDRYAEAHLATAPRLIKIDVEGAEVRVLRGMQQLLASTDRPPIVLEVSEGSLLKLGSSKEELFEIASAHGYTTREISKHRKSIFAGPEEWYQYDVLLEPAA